MSSTQNILEPKIITILKEGYSFKKFLQDMTAGIIVGIVAIPLSIAFAIASGVKPEQGIYTAFIGGFFISMFSGSRVQIGGPTGAFIVIVYDIVQKHGYEGLAVATVMAGVLLILMGLARFGDMITFIPYPVTVGFTSGIALIIFSTQIRDFFGMSIHSLPENFIDKWFIYIQNTAHINPWALLIGAMALFIIIFWPKITGKIPGALVAIILTTILVKIFNLPIETIGSRFGEVPTAFPIPQIPHFNLEMIVELSGPALTIALLAGVESLLSAVVADGMIGTRHRPNIELIAQGIANIASPLFQGIPATGAIARTATNVKNGGRTPIAGIIHALTVLIIFLFLGKLAALIPMPTLAGILIVVAYNMSEWQLFLKTLRSPRSDVIVLLITFFLTVLVNLTVAIEVGIILAAFLFMRRMVDVTEINSLTAPDEKLDTDSTSKKIIPPGVEVFEIYGPFFFGAANKFKDTLTELKKIPKVLILRMRHVPVIDATGLHALEEILERFRRNGVIIVIEGIQKNPLNVLRTTGLFDKIGPKNFKNDLDSALVRAQELLKQ